MKLKAAKDHNQSEICPKNYYGHIKTTEHVLFILSTIFLMCSKPMNA